MSAFRMSCVVEVDVGACKLEEAAHGRNDIIASNSAILP
jgi:hypothetical protein